jgi:biotin operon repressor
MIYARSLEIEQRLENLLALIREGCHSTPTLAKVLNVSIPTISRSINALRSRGHAIRSVKRGDGWAFVLDGRGGKKRNSRGHPHSRAT